MTVKNKYPLLLIPELIAKYLSCFDFVLQHRPGKSMGKPDALSHRSDHSTGADDNSDVVLLTPKLFAVRIRKMCYDLIVLILP